MYNNNGIARIPNWLVAMGFAMIMLVCGAWVYNHYKEQCVISDPSSDITSTTTNAMYNLANKV